MRQLLALIALLAAAPATAQGFDPFHEARIANRLGAQVPLDQVLTDASGRATSLRALAGGRVLVLAPVLHRCPNLCGVTLAGLAQAVAAQRGVPGKDFVVVAFGIDAREGPDAARNDLARLGATGARLDGFHAVTGSDAAIHAVTDAIGYHFAWDARIGQVAHAAGVALLTPDGRLSSWIYGVAPQPAALSAALDRARAAAPPPRWTEPLLLLCYHYDPATGRYTLAITRVLQLAGLATMLGIAALLFHLRRRTA